MKTRKCKYCKAQFQPYTTLQKNCFEPDCVTAWIQETKEKNWKRKKAKLKMDLMTIQDYIKLAQQVFNKYIRLRDKGQNCISCGKPALKENAGHFYNANNHWNVRFNELNVHLQCEHCNTYLSGNLINYRENLLKKIGIEDFELLSSEANKTRKFTVNELKEIIAVYKRKIKEIEK
ncbi:MAG: hypothetical protein RLZZ236_1979 [Bacteroidota bacterium]|jgi:hypothetical protein